MSNPSGRSAPSNATFVDLFREQLRLRGSGIRSVAGMAGAPSPQATETLAQLQLVAAHGDPTAAADGVVRAVQEAMSKLGSALGRARHLGRSLTARERHRIGELRAAARVRARSPRT